MNVTSAHLTTADRDELSRILATEIAFIHHSDFDLPDAERTIITDSPLIAAPDSSWLIRFMHTREKQGVKFSSLTIEQESQHFAAFNYCMFRAAKLQGAAMQDESAAGELLAWHRQGVSIRNRIVEWFLPLAIVAQRETFCIAGHRIRRPADMSFDELVAEATIAIIDAASVNAWTKGRFSTIAMLYIAGRYSNINAYAKRRKGQLDLCPLSGAHAELAAKAIRSHTDSQRDHHAHELIEHVRVVMRDNLAGLSDEERKAIELRFGPGDSKQTTIARAAAILHRGVCKVRALIRAALCKLRVAVERIAFRHVVTMEVAARWRQREDARHKCSGRASSYPRSAWGEWVYQRALSLGLETMENFARAVKIGRRHLRVVLNRDCASPKLIDRLCKGLKVSRDMLLTGWRDTCID